MAGSVINFFSEEISHTVKQKKAIKSWISDTIKAEGFELQELNIILCSDDYLLNINKTYLNHNTYTDIITFDNSENAGKIILGDIFISIERVFENSKKFNVSKTDELHRVIIHGTLHLLGYKDKSPKEKALMTKKENEYLKLRKF